MSVHHWVQQPWGPEHQPGNAMGQWGTHFGRYQTWWEPGKAWFQYLWRCQTLLQTGSLVPASPQTSAQLTAKSGKLELQSIHRRRGEEDIYFVANVARTAGVASCSFAVQGKQPELWDPVRGTMRALPEFASIGGRTSFEVPFEPAQSFFVVFRKPATAAGGGANFPAMKAIATLTGPWAVHFDPAWGGPAEVEFASLEDWTKRPEPGIRYYSGTATYQKNVHLEANKKLYLSLGAVHHLATVTVNGSKAGVVWTAPWMIDISDAVVTGENKLEIAVTNVWANRLIGDEQQPADMLWQEGDPHFHSGYSLKEFPDWFLQGEPRPSRGRYAFTTWNYFTRESPLVASGLLGPVKVMMEV